MNRQIRALLRGAAPALILALFVLCLYAHLLFTNRVLASGDILLYFYPYRDYAAAAVRNGEIPLWNPYIFLGVPFLANPQAAVLYPLHWPLSWLPVTKQLYWSAALHTWLLGLGGYWLLRRWGVGAWAGLAGALILSGSGFVGGLIGHINQLNGVAWLPWALLVLDRTDDWFVGRLWLGRLWALLWLGLLVCLMLLAGHTQTVYINLVGVGVWAIWPALATFGTVAYSRWRAGRGSGGRDPFSAWPVVQTAYLIWPRLLVYAGGVVLGIAMSSAQLLPTLELSALGLRSGGLPYNEVSSFSLRPLHLLWTLLPSYGLVDLSVVFATSGYSEFVAYIGLAGMILAALGAWRGKGTLRHAGLLFAGMGLFLAAGRWNPFYFLFYLVIPGFDLFRVPARWMMLYTVGAAALAAAGGEVLLRSRQPMNGRGQTAVLLGALLLGAELVLAARALPHTHTTAAQAVEDLRTAPAHLLSDPQRSTLGAASGRFLGMSTITYDPGDMQDLRRIYQPQDAPPILDDRAFEQLIIALKVQELLVPNLALFWRIPSVDGFDGGVLPLQQYNRFLTLFLPAAELVPDGRLREQVRVVPDAALLGLLNVRYLITDKVRDLWFEDIYYDRQIGARLHKSGREEVRVDAEVHFEATHLDLIGYIEGDESTVAALQNDLLPVAEVTVEGEDGQRGQLVVTAGGQPGAHLADGALDSTLAADSGATVAWRDVEQGRAEYRVRLALDSPMSPRHITIRRLDLPEHESLSVIIQAATLVDERTGTFEPLLPSDRGRFRLVHSGDVKIYENLDVLPRAYLAHRVLGVEDMETALDTLRMDRHEMLPDAGVRTAVVEGIESFESAAAEDDEAQIVRYAAEEVEIRTRSRQAAFLVLSDSFYPGWKATVDNQPAAIYRTNGMMRGVRVPAGEHTVRFRYEPDSWHLGWRISVVSWALWLCALLACLSIRIRRPLAPDV